MTSNATSPFPKRKLGRTRVEVSELGLGTAPLGDLWDVVDEDEARALLNAAWDGGVRYFDTSPWYGKGQAEHRVGRALYRKPRDEFVISSKVGRVLRRPRAAQNGGARLDKTPFPPQIPLETAKRL